jgi:hypothetical protein
LRLKDFASDRRKSKLSKHEQSKGLFKSVELATKEVEDIKLMAERAMFLGTRMPLFTGYFADVWLSQLSINPEVKEVLTDLQRISKVSERLANVAEQLPSNIAKERQALIQQGKDLLTEETRLRGFLAELRQTLPEGNNLIISANSLAEQLELGSSAEHSEPFDIKDYTETVAEVNVMVKHLNLLVGSVEWLLNSQGLQNLLPHLDQTINLVEEEGMQVVNHIFWRAVFLIMIWMTCYILARLTLHYLTQRQSKSSIEEGHFRYKANYLS